MLTPRENLINFFKDEPYEWIPSSADFKKFCPTFYPDNKSRGLVLQQNPISKEEYGGKDIFGVDWIYEPLVGGSMEKENLFDDIDDLLDWENKLVIPDLDKFDWEGCKAENAEYLKTDKMLAMTIYTGYFERLISLVGFEDAAVAMIDEDYSEAVGRLFERLTDFYIDFATRMHNWFGIEWVEFHDDWGNQKSLMFSRATHDELIMPCVTRLYKELHENGIVVCEQHSCGRIDQLMPSIIKSGADTWRGQNIVDKKLMVDTYGDGFKFGVNVAGPADFNEEGAMAAVREALEMYKGKKVWFNLYWFPDKLSDMALEIIKAADLK